MSMMEAVKNVFQNYATFSGRARRSEYWYFCLFNLLVSLGISVLVGIGTAVGGEKLGTVIGALSYIYALAVFIPGLAVCWRRLHDTGRSGGYYFMGLIPLVGVILLIVWLCQDSQPGDTQYGPNPKGMGGYGFTPNYSNPYSGDPGVRQAPPMNGGYSFVYCSNCGTQMRLPTGSGRVRVRCPRCGAETDAQC